MKSVKLPPDLTEAVRQFLVYADQRELVRTIHVVELKLSCTQRNSEVHQTSVKNNRWSPGDYYRTVEVQVFADHFKSGDAVEVVVRKLPKVP